MKAFTPHTKPVGTNTMTGLPAYWCYTLHPKFTSTGFKTEAAAKAAMTKHLKRGGLTKEFFRRLNTKLIRDADGKVYRVSK